jgi:hypothetical protein
MANNLPAASSCTDVYGIVREGLYGPLTTVFTPPTSCYEAYYYTTNTVPSYYLPPLPWGANDSVISPECGPSNFLNPTIGNYGWFSPGICPDGYTSAANSTWGLTAISDWFENLDYGGCSYPLVTSEATVWCCPL